MARALDVLNTKTAFLVVRECFYGTTRFDDFVRRTGTTAPTVSRALQHLERAGVITRVAYQVPGERAREAYELTPAGRELLPVFLALMQWGDSHLQEAGAPLAFVDSATQQQIAVQVTTGDDHAVTTDDIEIRLAVDPSTLLDQIR